MRSFLHPHPGGCHPRVGLLGAAHGRRAPQAVPARIRICTRRMDTHGYAHAEWALGYAHAEWALGYAHAELALGYAHAEWALGYAHAE